MYPFFFFTLYYLCFGFGVADDWNNKAVTIIEENPNSNPNDSDWNDVKYCEFESFVKGYKVINSDKNVAKVIEMTCFDYNNSEKTTLKSFVDKEIYSIDAPINCSDFSLDIKCKSNQSTSNEYVNFIKGFQLSRMNLMSNAFSQIASKCIDSDYLISSASSNLECPSGTAVCGFGEKLSAESYIVGLKLACCRLCNYNRGFYLSSNGKDCEYCHPTCKTCRGGGDNDCLSCYFQNTVYKHRLIDGKCKPENFEMEAALNGNWRNNKDNYEDYFSCGYFKYLIGAPKNKIILERNSIMVDRPFFLLRLKLRLFKFDTLFKDISQIINPKQIKPVLNINSKEISNLDFNSCADMYTGNQCGDVPFGAEQTFVLTLEYQFDPQSYNENFVGVELHIDNDILDLTQWGFSNFSVTLLHCDITCKTCNGPSFLNCLTCFPNAHLTSSSTCDCDAGYFRAPKNFTCVKVCENNQWYNNFTDNCEDACGKNEYQSLNDRMCKACHPTCGSCTSWQIDSCLTCDPDSVYKYLISNCIEGSCENLCPVEYPLLEYDNDQRKCHKICSPPLKEIMGNKTCQTICPSNYQEDVKRNKCIKNCHYTCGESSCESDKVDKCFTCGDPNRELKVSGNDTSIGSCVCRENYFEEKYGYPKCAKCHSSCRTCNASLDTNCTTCDEKRFLTQEGKCKCYPNYYELIINNRESCRACHKSCFSCDGPTANNCTSCYSNYEILNKMCVCERGRYLYNGSCERCHYSCLACTSMKPIICTDCPPTRELNEQGHCVCNIGMQEAEGNQSRCIDVNCSSGCELCKTPELCLKCKNNFDLLFNKCRCKRSYYLYGDACKECHYSCGRCTGASSNECLGECSSVFRGEKGTPISNTCPCREGFRDISRECIETEWTVGLSKAHSKLSEVSGFISMFGLLVYAAVSQFFFVEIQQLISLSTFLDLDYYFFMRTRYLLDLKWQRLDLLAYAVKSEATHKTIISFHLVEEPDYARLLSMIYSLLIIILAIFWSLFWKIISARAKSPKLNGLLNKMSLFFGWRFALQMFNLFAVGHTAYIVIEFTGIHKYLDCKSVYFFGLTGKLWAVLLLFIHSLHFVFISYLSLTDYWINNGHYQTFSFIFEDFSLLTRVKRFYSVLLIVRRVLFCTAFLVRFEDLRKNAIILLVAQTLIVLFLIAERPISQLNRLIVHILIEVSFLIYLLLMFFLTTAIPIDEKINSTFGMIIILFIHQFGLILGSFSSLLYEIYYGKKYKGLEFSLKKRIKSKFGRNRASSNKSQMIPEIPQPRDQSDIKPNEIKNKLDIQKNKELLVVGKEVLKASELLWDRSKKESNMKEDQQENKANEEIRMLLKTEPVSSRRDNIESDPNQPSGKELPVPLSVQNPEENLEKLPFTCLVNDNAVVRSKESYFILNKNSEVTVVKLFEDVGIAEVSSQAGQGLIYIKDLNLQSNHPE